MSKTGIKLVAELSGVSPATVSRTLSNPDIVSATTRERVLQAIEQCGYTPNRFGASLRTQKSGSIVVIIPDITNSFNAGIIRSIEDAAAKAGYSVLLGDTQRDADKVKHYAAMVRSGQVDGIILFSQHLPFDVEPGTTVEQLPPIVNSCEPLNVDDVCQVMINNVDAAKTAVNHLIELGHRRIGAITGNMDAPSSNDRLTGYKLALEQAGIAFDPDLITNGNYLIGSGKIAATKLLELPEPPTAIFCFSDNIAYGAMSALHDHNIKVPEQMSLVGFDDTEYSAYMNPPLTTIHQPLVEIGQNCMDLLLAQLEHKPIARRYIELPVQLLVRGSTGPRPS
ncbi:LacI family DNA-binding transcriptional regulator [Neptunicella sp. SCSIO 80796]|uniref:LacI family DNA-binding transcriptional regulator n=1 Tax=Neptunicella plasticusilytica TaxID=3117012 RepID=UPI003A4DBF38